MNCKIQEIANANDAIIIEDRQGDIAILARHYDSDGKRVIRHRPDPCEFRPVSHWLAMTPEQAAAAIA
jgi:hypothetical protein